MRQMLSSLLAILLLAASPATPPGAGQLLDEVVALIRSPGGEQRVVTLSKLREEARIALVAHGAPDAATRPLDGPALQAAFEWYLDQTLLLDEATRLRVFEVDRADALAELRRFQARFARPADYQSFLDRQELTEEELLAVLRRMVRVQRYLDSRVIRSSRVAEKDLEDFYQGHRAEFGDLPFAEVRDRVKARLVEERIASDVKAVVADLRGRATVRMLVDLSHGT
jgi:hypothetical protein